jgi:hypothetical protein
MASVGTFAAIQILLAVAEFGVLGPVAGASPLTFAKAPSPRNPVSALLTPSRYPRPRMAVSYVRSLHASRRAFATLQAIGMIGQLIPIATEIGAAAAAVAEGLTWAFGRTGQGEERPHQE